MVIHKTRHELQPVLAALQYIFSTPELNERIFALIEGEIEGDKQKTGRPGMDYWEILVFSTVRLALNIDYDGLQDLANFHTLVRQIAGEDNKFNEGKTYGLQTLKDNIGLLDG